MLQNFSREFYTNEQSENTNVNYKQNINNKYTATYEEDAQENKLAFQDIFEKLFTIQNIFIYILTFMISMVGMGNNDSNFTAPFGIALMVAAISGGVPIVGVFIAGVIGTLIKFGMSSSLMYFAMCVLLLLLIIIKKPAKEDDTNERMRLGGYLLFSTLIIQLVYILFKGFYFYDLMQAIVMSITAYIFYKIFVNSIQVISQYGIKRVFSVEEIIGASLLLAIAVSCLGTFTIFNFSIRNIICIFIVLVMGWRNGILVGGTSGTTVGIVLGIIGDGNPTLIAAYAISGMIAGLMNKFGKIGVVLGFILGNIIVAYSANGGINNIIMFQEILIASVGLLALPKSTKINIEDIMPSVKLLPEAGGRIEEGADTLLKLNTISETLNQMTNSYKQDNMYEQNVQMFQDELIKAIDGLEGNILYDEIYNDGDKFINDIFDNLQDNNVITENAIISILAKHSIYVMTDNQVSNEKQLIEIREMIKAINSAYRICKNNFIWQKKIEEKNKNMSQQLTNVKSAIEDIKSGIEENENEFGNEKLKIKTNLIDDDVIVKDITIKKEESGRKIINVFTDVCSDENVDKCPIKTINKEINKVFGEKFVIQNQLCGIRLSKSICQYSYLSEDKYLIQTGIATAKKDGSIISGDMTSQIRLADGKYLFAISDGMGSGPESRRNSKIAISMLERLLSSGFEKETSIQLINSAIINANKEDMYATLDIVIMDLYDEKMELLKSGACPTYIKQGRNVNMVVSTSLPAGVSENLKIDTYDKQLKDGDIVVICSDGIIESNNEFDNKELWIKYLLEDIQTDIPERIADIILRESIDNEIGKAKDDMSVIVAKIIKKK